MSFLRKKKSLRLGLGISEPASPPVPPKNDVRLVSAPQGNQSMTTTEPRITVDDFGRPVVDRPAFTRQLQGVHGVGEEKDGPTEFVLEYGFTPIETALELPVERVLRLVTEASREIRARGLETPQILSSMALDISLESTCGLIRSYLADPQLWLEDLAIADALNVGAFMKWGLARLVNDQGGRGFISMTAYNQFKAAERISMFSPTSIKVHLLDKIPAANARLLTTVLELFANIAAHSKANGMPPRRLAGTLGAYIFGLPDDETFDATYIEWQRATNATEHLLLAYIRSQDPATLPTHLARHIVGYPETLNLDYNVDAPPRLPAGAQTEEVVRIRRLARFHSRNLIASAGTWEVPRSIDWELLFPAGDAPHGTPKIGEPASTVYSAQYRHLLNIRSGAFLDDDDEDGEYTRYKSLVDKEWHKFGELGFRDVEPGKLQFDLSEGERNRATSKRDTLDWGTFANSGFSRGDSFSPADLIFHQSIDQQVKTWPATQQDLNRRLKEAEKLLPSFPYDTTAREESRIQVDSHWFEAWADILVAGGWARDELKESSFALIQWKSRPRLSEVGAKDRTADSDGRTEDRWFLVEEFVPKEYRDQLKEQKQQAKKSSKRISFMRAVRRKDSVRETSQSGPARQIRHPHHQGNGATLLMAPLASSTSRPLQQQNRPMRPIDETVFSEDSTHETKLLRLSNENLTTPGTAESLQGGPHTPSFVSTTGARHGHSNIELDQSRTRTPEPKISSLPMPIPSVAPAVSTQAQPPQSPEAIYVPESGVYEQGAAPLQTPSSPPRPIPVVDRNKTNAAPVGYTKPSGPKGFLARISSKRSKNKQPGTLVKISPRLGFGMFDWAPKTPEKDDFHQGSPFLAPVVETSNARIEGTAMRPHDEEDPYGGIADESATRVGNILLQDDDDEVVRDDPEGTVQTSIDNDPTSPTVSEAAGHSESNRTSAWTDNRDSGVTDFSSRVQKIVGLYEARDSTTTSATPSSPRTPDMSNGGSPAVYN